MTSSSFDVAIVGAGIVGAACAAECAAEGMRVAVIESEVPGGGATAAGMGHIVVMDDSEAQFALTHYSRTLWNELAPQLPSDAQVDPCGTMWVATNDDEMAEVARKREFCRTKGVAAEVLDAKALEEAEPNLRKGLSGGLWVPDDLVVYAPCVVRYLLDQAKARGAEMRVGSAVVAISAEGVRLGDGSVVSSKVVVNATGTGAAEFVPGLELKKRKGHLVITDRYPGFVRHQLLELGYLKSAHSLTTDSVAFNVQPRRTGQVLIGSSRQYGAEDSKVEAHMVRRMLARAIEFMPELARLSVVRTWAGFRAATPDKLPLIGPSPVNDRHFLATGHEGLGITTSLGTAKLIVDQIMKRPSKIPVEPYLPMRMIGGAAHA